jgi:hypothetical protein
MEDEENHGMECDAGDDDHIVAVRIEYLMGEDDDGDPVPRAASIQSHCHGVPPLAAAQTLLLTAQNFITQHLAHDTFESCPDEGLKHAMAAASAAVYMKKMIDDLPDLVDEVVFSVPNDLSELLGEE